MPILGEGRPATSDEQEDALGRYLGEIDNAPILSPEDEREFASRIHSGQGVEEARRALIEANLRTVVAVARDYERPGLHLLDLIQEGNIGLMRALDRFDPATGVRFSTYATRWIREAIARAIDEL